MSKKELLFSITKDDFDFIPTKGSGNGGQHRNKTLSACHCKHRASGAAGYAEDTRCLPDNKKLAWKRCIETKEFKNWYKLEVAKRTGALAKMEEEVNRQMQDKYIKMEVKNEKGLWEETKEIPNE